MIKSMEIAKKMLIIDPHNIIVMMKIFWNIFILIVHVKQYTNIRFILKMLASQLQKVNIKHTTATSSLLELIYLMFYNFY